MALFWSLVAGLFYRLVRTRAGVTSAALIALLVFSHWLMDLVMHKPDLLIWFGGDKIGFGLWQNRMLSFSLEVALFLGGMAIFLARTPARGWLGVLVAGAFLVMGVALQIIGNFSPPPSGPETAAISAIVAYLMFTLMAIGVDATRRS